MKREYGKISFITGIIFVLLLGGILYYQKLSIAKKAKEGVVKHIDALKESNEYTDIHLLTIHAQHNQDRLKDELISFDEHMTYVGKNLKNIEIPYETVLPFYREVEQDFRIKKMLIEDMKSSNAVISNSMAFLMDASSELLYRESQNRSIDYKLHKLLMDIVNKHLKKTLNPQDSFDEFMEYMQGDIVPGKTVSSSPDGLLFNNQLLYLHIRAISNNYALRQEAHLQLRVMQLATHIEEFSSFVHRSIEGDEQKERYVTYGLFSLIVIFLMGILYGFLREIQKKNKIEQLKRSLQVLNRSLDEQVQELGEFKNALDNSAVVSKTDTHGRITYVNEKFCEVSGYSKEELLGKSHSIIRHPDMPKALFAELWKTIKNKEIFRARIKNRKKDGGSYYVDSTIVPILNTKGEISEYLAIRYEVTELVLAHEQAVLADKLKDEFLSNMSHEIRTPLNGILGFVKVLKKRSKEKEMLKYLDIVHSSGEALEAIINDILDFSKIRSGKFAIDIHPFDPAEELSHAVLLFASKAYEKKISYLTFIDPGMPSSLMGDSGRVKQVVSNFLSNAVKFTPEHGIIKVKVTYNRASGCLECSVNDSGIGIDPEHQERIFKSFEQADGSTTRKYGGTGLGLAICVKLAALMDGNIDLKSKKGAGSTFGITIPMEISREASDHADEQKLRAISVYMAPTLSKKSEPAMKLMQLYLNAYNIFSKERSGEADISIVALEEHNGDAILLATQPTIVLLNEPTDHFDDRPHIWPLVAPYTPGRVLEALDEVTAEHLRKNGKATEAEAGLQFGGHILVAEDNRTNQMLIQTLLEEYGVTCEMASDGLEAVEAFKNGRFDIVLMDENMPNKNGLQAHREMVAFEKAAQREHTPVVALTANVMEEDKNRFLSAGMDGFLGKPIDAEELKQTLSRFLGVKKADEAQSAREEPAVAADIDRLSKEIGIPARLVKELYISFLEESKSIVEELEASVERRDYEKMEFCAHSLKGMAGNLKFTGIFEHSKEIEAHSRLKSATYDYIKGVAEIRSLLQRLQPL